MMYVYGCYFQSEDDARAWLAFDADEEEIERAAYAEPDRHAEWERWRAGALGKEDE